MVDLDSFTQTIAYQIASPSGAYVTKMSFDPAYPVVGGKPNNKLRNSLNIYT